MNKSTQQIKLYKNIAHLTYLFKWVLPHELLKWCILSMSLLLSGNVVIGQEIKERSLFLKELQVSAGGIVTGNLFSYSYGSILQREFRTQLSPGMNFSVLKQVGKKSFVGIGIRDFTLQGHNNDGQLRLSQSGIQPWTSIAPQALAYSTRVQQVAFVGEYFLYRNMNIHPIFTFRAGISSVSSKLDYVKTESTGQDSSAPIYTTNQQPDIKNPDFGIGTGVAMHFGNYISLKLTGEFVTAFSAIYNGIPAFKSGLPPTDRGTSSYGVIGLSITSHSGYKGRYYEQYRKKALHQYLPFYNKKKYKR